MPSYRVISPVYKFYCFAPAVTLNLSNLTSSDAGLCAISRSIPYIFPCRSASFVTPKPHPSTVAQILSKTKAEFEKMKTAAEYGAWISPITSDVAAGSEVQFAGLERDGCSAEANSKTPSF